MENKTCMHCQKEIPQEAMFCPFCGGKQNVEPEKKIIKKTDKDMNDAFFGQSEKEQRNIKKIDLSAIKEESEEPEREVTEIKQEEKNVTNESSEQAEASVEGEEDGSSLFAGSDMDEETKAQMEEAFSLFSKEKENEGKEDNKKEISSNPEEEKELNQEPQKKKDSAKHRLMEKMNNASKSEEGIKRKSKKKDSDMREETLDASDMTEEEGTSETSSGFSYDGDNELKDEMADRKKKEEAKKKEEKEGDSKEGRRKKGRTKEARKNIDKIIAARKVEDIEHEKTAVTEDEEDKDYDGYYESVLPIDHDKMRDNSAYIKVGITAVAFLALATGLFYLVISFFTM